MHLLDSLRGLCSCLSAPQTAYRAGDAASCSSAEYAQTHFPRATRCRDSAADSRDITAARSSTSNPRHTSLQEAQAILVVDRSDSLVILLSASPSQSCDLLDWTPVDAEASPSGHHAFGRSDTCGPTAMRSFDEAEAGDNVCSSSSRANALSGFSRSAISDDGSSGAHAAAAAAAATATATGVDARLTWVNLSSGDDETRDDDFSDPCAGMSIVPHDSSSFRRLRCVAPCDNVPLGDVSMDNACRSSGAGHTSTASAVGHSGVEESAAWAACVSEERASMQSATSRFLTTSADHVMVQGQAAGPGTESSAGGEGEDGAGDNFEAQLAAAVLQQVVAITSLHAARRLSPHSSHDGCDNEDSFDLFSSAAVQQLITGPEAARPPCPVQNLPRVGSNCSFTLRSSSTCDQRRRPNDGVSTAASRRASQDCCCDGSMTSEYNYYRGNSNLTSLPSSNLEVMDLTVHLDRSLGVGQFGIVYQGDLSGREVAVKVMRDLSGHMAERALESFCQEYCCLRSLSHPNVVQCLAGSCVPPHIYIVEELMHQTLADRLYRAQGDMGMQAIISIGLDVARGLSYIHSLPCPIVHCDLKPDNILLDHEGNAKISDFGLAQFVQTSSLQSHSRGAGTLAYMAPECLDPSLGYITDKSDVFSFGVLLWEMCAGGRPWEGLSACDFLQRMVVDDARLPIPDSDDQCPMALRHLISDCWDTDPAARPACRDIVAVLERMLRFTPAH